MKTLWTEKYRPNSVDDYVFKDTDQKSQVQSWIKEGSIPHLLFSGSAGIGKTTLAKVLLNELKIETFDILEINASRENLELISIADNRSNGKVCSISRDALIDLVCANPRHTNLTP